MDLVTWINEPPFVDPMVRGPHAHAAGNHEESRTHAEGVGSCFNQCHRVVHVYLGCLSGQGLRLFSWANPGGVGCSCWNLSRGSFAHSRCGRLQKSLALPSLFARFHVGCAFAYEVAHERPELNRFAIQWPLTIQLEQTGAEGSSLVADLAGSRYVKFALRLLTWTVMTIRRFGQGNGPESQ